jgi:predicted phosphodiesterase
MQAIISDLHSNLPAIEAILEDIVQQGAEEIVCLGDVVGYGPSPVEAIDRSMRMCRFVLSGNHDYAVITKAVRFNPLAEEAVEFTRQELKPTALSLGRKKTRWQFLEQLPTRIEEGAVLYVHGSPRDDRNEYILESDMVFGNQDKISDIFTLVTRLLFVGHTHVPGIINTAFEFLHPDGDNVRFDLDPQEKYIINVGSVGQPRDGDNRACYVLFDDGAVTYRRVSYDFRKTMTEMTRVGPISHDAADRLEYGR